MSTEQIKDNFPDAGDFFQTIFENSPQPMYVYDLETFKFLAVNNATVEHYGYTREEFLSMSIEEIRPPEEVSRLVHMISQLGLGVQHLGSWKHRRKDGSLMDVEISSHGVLFGGRKARFVIVQDVTERKRAVEALRKSEEKYRDLFENANDAIFIVSSDLRYLDVNKKAVDVLGYAKEELLTMKITDLIPSEQLPRAEAEFDKLRNRGSYETFVGKVRTKEGRLLDVEVSSSAIIEDGTIIGSRDIMRDITDRKSMEEELLRAQKLESIGTLAGGIAHDFNNLLQGFFGYISMAKMTIDQKEKSLAMLEQAEKALHQSVNLTNQLLTFSKGGKPVKKLIDLRPVIENSAKFTLSGSRSDLHLNIPQDLWQAEADAGQLEQVIQNIVLNADQAMPVGGTVRVAAANMAEGAASLPLGLANGNYVVVTIQDTGVGIPEQYLIKIFEPYFTTKEKGSGLGLATSYSIVRNHGGMIDVKTKSGVGTTFRIYLPAIAGAARVEAAVGPTKSSLSRTARILVMDDEEIIRNMSSELLGALGHDVEVAKHGQEALEKYQEAMAAGKPFDIVILDLTVRGGMGGSEAIQKLLEIDPMAKAIVSSGYSDDATTSNYEKQGFKAFLKKPYDIVTLREVLVKMLSF